MQTDPYASGVLVPEHHDRLVAGLASFARAAGIQPRWVWTPLAATCGEAEIEYLKRFRHHQAAGELEGLCYIASGPSFSSVNDRMYAIAGFLTRNFLRASVMTVSAVLEAVSAGSTPDHDCLLIPNFFLRKSEGGGISSWHVAALYDLLMTRAASGGQTVIFVSSLTGLENEYGSAVANLVQSSFLKIAI